MQRKVLVLVFLAVAVLSGCKDVQMVLDLSGDRAFYDRGFPSDLCLTPQGTPDVSKFPNSWNPTIKTYMNVVDRDVEGFSPAMPVYMRFEGDIPYGDVLLSNDPLSYANENAPVQLINIDPNSNELGARHAIKVSLQKKLDEYRPAGLLQALPIGKFLQENTTYALIATRAISPKKGEDITQNPVLGALLEGGNPRAEDSSISVAMALRALEVYAPLRTQLAADGIDTDDVVGAVVWTTGEPSGKLRGLVDAVNQWEAPEPNYPLECIEETDEYYILRSEWTVPGLQCGLFPYPLPINGGRIHYLPNGDPMIQYFRNTPFVLTIPKTPMPENGYPLVFYNHGTGGFATQVYERGVVIPDGTPTNEGCVASLAARQGWAASGMGGHFGGDHEDQHVIMNAFLDLVPMISLNIAAYNFINPQAMRDNFFQMIAERTLFRRLVNSLAIDPALCPGLDVEGPIFFDVSKQVIAGQSLGAGTATAQATNDPMGFQGLVGTGAGSYGLNMDMYITVLTDGKPFGNLLEPTFFGTRVNTMVEDPCHPVWALSELALGECNISIHASRWTRNPEVEIPKPHVFIVEGYYDDWVPVEVQQPLLRALEVDLAGPELDVPEEDQLLTWIEYAGNTRLDYPVSGNRDGRTSAVVRYEEDGIMSGHHVFFQLEAPQNQFMGFIDDINRGLVPEIVE